MTKRLRRPIENEHSCIIQVKINKIINLKKQQQQENKKLFACFLDRFPNESEEVKKEEEKKFKEIGEAYAVLSDAKKRSRYDNGQDLDEMSSGMSSAG
jgi:DnaJ-class molecular chaperone